MSDNTLFGKVIMSTHLFFFTVIGLSAGNLDGKTVFLSPGHGFYHHRTYNWTTQRGLSENVIEDFTTSDIVFSFLTSYLRRAGADVIPLRCECPSEIEVIVDNKSADYTEKGTWKTTSSKGFRGSARFCATGPDRVQSARFTPHIPSSGYYPLYIWYKDGRNRTSRASVSIQLMGNRATTTVNQQKHGNRWRYIGSYYFFAGRGQAVEITAQSPESGKVVIADAIRIGGGRGDAQGGNSSISGRSRYDECALSWAHYQGAPGSVLNQRGGNDRKNDIVCRGAFAEFLREETEQSLYLSFHTNAGGGSGTETYIYEGALSKENRLFQHLIQQELISDLRSSWNPRWKDRKTKQADLGELRMLRTMPGVLVEAAFHDHPSDRLAIQSPSWRNITCRALYQATARYFNGPGAVLLPEPPRRLSVRSLSSSTAFVSWKPPANGPAACGADPAATYLLEQSFNGFSYETVKKTSQTNAVLDHLPAHTPVFVRVVACNKAGRSFPSQTGGLILPGKGTHGTPLKALLIANRSSDLGTVKTEELLTHTRGRTIRFKPGRSAGGGDHIVEHIWALWGADKNVRCDFTALDAACALDLSPYGLIVLSFGGEKEDLFSPRFLSMINEHIDGGGKVIISGARFARFLNKADTPASKRLLQTLGIVSSKAHTTPERLLWNRTGRPPILCTLGETTDWGLSGSCTFDLLTPLPEASGQFVCSGGYGCIYSPRVSISFSFPLERLPAASLRTVVYDTALQHLFPQRHSAGLAQSSGSSPDTPTNTHSAATAPDPAAKVWRKGNTPIGNDTTRGFATKIDQTAGGGTEFVLKTTFEVPESTTINSLLLDITAPACFSLAINGNTIPIPPIPHSAASDGGTTSSRHKALRHELDVTALFGPFLRSGGNTLVIQCSTSLMQEEKFTVDCSLRAFFSNYHSFFLVPPGSCWQYTVEKGPQPDTRLSGVLLP